MAHPADDGTTDDALSPRFRTGLTLLLLAIAAFGAVDLALDRPDAWLSFHVAFELAFVTLALAAVAHLWRGRAAAQRRLRRTEGRLAEREADRDHWRRRAETLLRGLGVEIDAQLARWSLTPAEREVALLLLKGFGHKEVAALLGRSERTVRQHAVAVYRKSGLGGRAELSAFFLEDLLLPAREGAAEAEAAAPGARADSRTDPAAR